jgi:transposase
MTADLLVLHDWLRSKEVTHVAMESTGVFWKPIYNLLEDSFTVLLVNAAHIKRVPGRKTDVTDCEWIADLLAHGLLKGSFIPPKPIRELRDLTRYRKSLSDERVREVNRLHKLLQSANIKLSSVASDVMGMSGRKMLEALLGGNTDPEVLADLARGKLRKKLPELRKALQGCFSAHHRLILEHILGHVDFLDEAMERISEEVAAHTAPFDEQIQFMDTIPGGIARRLRARSPRSDWTWSNSPRIGTWPPGRVCAQATMKALESARRVGCAKATCGSGVMSLRWPWLPPEPRGLI